MANQQLFQWNQWNHIEFISFRNREAVMVQSHTASKITSAWSEPQKAPKRVRGAKICQ